MEEIREQILKWIEEGNFEKIPPYGGLYFSKYDNRSLEYTVITPNTFGGWIPFYYRRLSTLQEYYPAQDRRGHAINLVNNIYRKPLIYTIVSTLLWNQIPEELPITTYYQAFPEKLRFNYDIMSIVGMFLFGFCACFLLPNFVANLVLDKQERILILMKLSGLKMRMYWMTNYLYFFMEYMVIVILTIATGLAFGVKLFTQTHWFIVLILYATWGHALISMSFVLSTFFNKIRTASVFCYFFIALASLICNHLNGAVFLLTKAHWILTLFPVFSFYRSIFLLEFGCLNLLCYQMDALSLDNEFATLTLTTFISSSLLLVLAIYLHEVLPSDFGLHKSPLFLFMSRKKSKSGDEEERLVGTSEHSILIENLSKTFEGKNKKVALTDLHLKLDENDFFGLLGPNGAGKTTLISILTGLIAPSQGSVRLYGQDAVQEKDIFQQFVGLCPQFDIFYPDLTSLQHLQFYSKLRGLTSNKDSSFCQQLLKQTELTEHQHKKAKFLSGGMKRRLSLAIALVGSPKIVILDEPTTGLDPLTRRHLWEIFKNLGHNRTVLLTTHSMDEAEILCNKIGVLVDGQMVAMGSCNDLKSRFNQGYILTLIGRSNEIETLKFNVENAYFHGITMQFLPSSFSTRLLYRVEILQKNTGHLGSLIERIEKWKREQIIADWALNTNSLEQVFLSLINQ